MVSALEIIPFIVFLVVIGTAIAERINIPYPLVLVVGGLMVGFVPGIPSWHPPSDIVLTLFLPPILFAAARLISWEDLKNNLLEIGTLSILLVIITAVSIAFIFHWIAPAITVSAALVLGAIISPTDATAATSILNRVNAKKSLTRTLEIESLFNDAVSIVLYNMAVLFVIRGTISFRTGLEDSLIGGFGGVGIGLLLAYFTSLITQEFLTNSENELPIIMSLILAYISYLFAIRIGVSGVLAVVTAGLFHKRTERHIRARTRLSEKAAWDTYIFFLNGLIFMIIGLQFPTYLHKVSYLPGRDLFYLSALAISTLLVFRFILVSITSSIRYAIKKTKKSDARYPWANIFIATWSGMRGIVSLALAIAIPLTLNGTQLFPFRPLIIFLTIITILFTLLIEGLTLPLLIKFLKVEDSDKSLLKIANDIYRELTKEALEHIKKLDTKESFYSPAAKKLVDSYYANRLLRFKLSYATTRAAHDIAEEAHDFLTQILNHERALLHDMLEQGKIDNEIYIRITRKMDRDEVGFASYK